MAFEKLDYRDLKRCLTAGSDYLELNSKILDNLNVFPVPDGDTGINMVHTMRSAVGAISDPACDTLACIAERLGRIISESSRGNSGFILAQFWNGFFRAIRGAEYITPVQLAAGFSGGSYAARTSLFTPIEGTMITIISVMAEVMETVESESLLDFLNAALISAREKVRETPDILPILAKAGVVDSGALGFVFIMEGVVRGLTGQAPESECEETFRFAPSVTEGNGGYRPLIHRYCAELVVRGSVNGGSDRLRQFLADRGDSIALMAEGGILKLHIHTNVPEEIIREMEGIGEIIDRKIDDMEGQVAAFAPLDTSPHAVCSVLAVAPGDGFASIFRELGAADVVVYGDTLPTAGDIRETLDSMNAEDIIVLANDTNIVPAARLAGERSRKTVSIFPSRNVVEGIAALYSFLEDSGHEENLRAMAESSGSCIFLAAYRCGRDTTFGGRLLSEGDCFVVRGDDILSAEVSTVRAVADALSLLDLSGKGAVTLFSGEAFPEEDGAPLCDAIRSAHLDLEVALIRGGQRKALLYISIE